MNGITALKPVYNRTTKWYDLRVVENADPLLVHEGFFVYDDAMRARNGILDARLLLNWSPKKVNAVLRYLNSVITPQQHEAHQKEYDARKGGDS